MIFQEHADRKNGLNFHKFECFWNRRLNKKHSTIFSLFFKNRSLSSNLPYYAIPVDSFFSVRAEFGMWKYKIQKEDLGKLLTLSEEWFPNASEFPFERMKQNHLDKIVATNSSFSLLLQLNNFVTHTVWMRLAFVAIRYIYTLHERKA